MQACNSGSTSANWVGTHGQLFGTSPGYRRRIGDFKCRPRLCRVYFLRQRITRISRSNVFSRYLWCPRCRPRKHCPGEIFAGGRVWLRSHGAYCAANSIRNRNTSRRVQIRSDVCLVPAVFVIQDGDFRSTRRLRGRLSIRQVARASNATNEIVKSGWNYPNRIIMTSGRNAAEQIEQGSDCLHACRVVASEKTKAVKLPTVVFAGRASY